MIKKVVALILTGALIVGTVLLCACRTPAQDDFDYDGLYDSPERSEPYGDMTMAKLNMASYGYTLKSEQGYNGWYYMSGKDVVLPLEYADNCWKDKDVSFDRDRVTVNGNSTAVRRFVANRAERAVIFGNVKYLDGKNSALFSIKLNGVTLYSKTLASGDYEGFYFETEAELTAGDAVDFTVTSQNAVISCNPVVYYGDASDETLYHLTSFGKYYGDVFPWYDGESGKLYMGFLWTDDARKGEYKNALEESDNMLTFREIPEANNYKIWQKYKENGRLNFLYDVNKYVDKTIYTFGARDNMIYKDEENNRLLIIAGCYYNFDSSKQTSDLVIYQTDDIFGLSRTKAGVKVAEGYSRNLPECPSLMKIGNRWYAFVSVAYNTVHQVGPLQYWTGDENVDCLDVDWTSKDFAFVDGEDLCAARPVKIGDKVYMWGWIPQTYDTMPWSPWGGYLNLPREIVQRKDGSLGGRMDKGLEKVLNYGSVYKLDVGNFETEQGRASFADGRLETVGESRVSLGNGFSRNFVRFTLDMSECGKAGYVMCQNGRNYEVAISRENGKAYLTVASPDDDKHKLNSRLEIPDSDVFDVKITVDNGIVEFFVNGDSALTAHTAMTNAPYSASLFSDGNAAFKDVAINKLIPYCAL